MTALPMHRLGDIAATGAAVGRPHSALAGACLAQAVADLRDDREWLAAEAAAWLREGGAGARWAELLGADELLADALDEVA